LENSGISVQQQAAEVNPNGEGGTHTPWKPAIPFQFEDDERFVLGIGVEEDAASGGEAH